MTNLPTEDGRAGPMALEDMVERVANAIYSDLCNIGAATWADAGIIARAAIAAMREPTEAQYEALSATGKMWRELDSKTVWQTYIDAALQGTEGPGSPTLPQEEQRGGG